MRDIQASTEGFPKIAINKVGVRNIELPITLSRPDGTEFSTMAELSSYCDLTENLKGINMSRIERTLTPAFKLHGRITDVCSSAVRALQEAHKTNHIYLKLRFKYPWTTCSPSTELESPEVANVEVETRLNDGVIRQFIGIETVGMSLCPCSKEMSLFTSNLSDAERVIFEGWKKNGDDKWPAMKSIVQKLEMAGFGAHNQKSFVSVKVELSKHVHFEEIINIINDSVSSKTFSVLKRPDEKWVTEVSYMGAFIDEEKKIQTVEGTGPKFVEDIARQVAEKLNIALEADTIRDYVIVVRNQESIHSNDIEAVAVLNAGRELI